MMRLLTGWLIAQALFAAGIAVRFEPLSPEVGPFPNDALTLADPLQKTGRRVNLPLPDCAARPSDCQDIAWLNQLDGFNPHPRIRIRFSGAIDPETLRDGVYFIALNNLTNEEFGLMHEGQRAVINQVIFDPATNTAYAKPDEFFDQHRRYALIVTTGVRDRAGDAVEADAAFTACITRPSGPLTEYCRDLARVTQQYAALFSGQRVAGAAIFTTLSATAWLESARRRLGATDAGVRIERGFAVSDLQTITLREQVGAGRFREETFPAALLGGAGRIVYGSFRSPSYLTGLQTIVSPPTGVEVPPASRMEELVFQAVLPASAKPQAGYPVVISGPGFGRTLIDSGLTAPVFGQLGLAAIAINPVGHGYGPQSEIVVRRRDGGTAAVRSGGRGIDMNGDGQIEAIEGCLLPAPLAARDCLRQTALDLMQLVRALRAGLDVDGDGTPDFDRERIYYFGISNGSIYGTMLHAVEPHIAASVFNVGGASFADIGRWSPAYRELARGLLALRHPQLLNRGTDFDENYVLRYQAAKVNDVRGAIEIQNLWETTEWASAPGDPLSYAPHLKSSTLPGVPIRPVLFQQAWGDRTVPNPQSTALIRAANMREDSRWYRHDLARAVDRNLPADPHAFLGFIIQSPSPPAVAVSLAGLVQVGGFLFSGGAAIPDVNELVRPIFGGDLFVSVDLLPEDLNFQP